MEHNVANWEGSENRGKDVKIQDTDYWISRSKEERMRNEVTGQITKEGVSIITNAELESKVTHWEVIYKKETRPKKL